MMTGDGKTKEHTSSVGTRMTWLAIALKFYNIVVRLSFTGSTNVHTSESRCGSRAKRVVLRMGREEEYQKGRKVDEVDVTYYTHFLPLMQM